jgi:hypothetical protein
VTAITIRLIHARDQKKGRIAGSMSRDKRPLQSAQRAGILRWPTFARDDRACS